MELTDEQLWILLCCDVTTLWNYGDSEEAKLQQLELLTLEQLDGTVHPPLLPGTTGYWRLTDLGHKILRKNIVCALRMLPKHYAIPTYMNLIKYFDDLTMEELPLLLTHGNSYLRTCARERMVRLNGTD